MDRAGLTRWVEGYERAWRAPGTEGLRALFADDAEYRPAPGGEPTRGLGAIARFWEAERAPGERFTLEWEIVAVDGPTGVVRAEVRYTHPEPALWHDLWIIRLDDDGRCTSFEEWFVRADGGA